MAFPDSSADQFNEIQAILKRRRYCCFCGWFKSSSSFPNCVARTKQKDLPGNFF